MILVIHDCVYNPDSAVIIRLKHSQCIVLDPSMQCGCISKGGRAVFICVSEHY